MRSLVFQPRKIQRSGLWDAAADLTIEHIAELRNLGRDSERAGAHR